MIEKSDTKHIWFRISRVFSVLALSAVVAVAVGFSVAGSLAGEPWRANFAFSLLLMALLTAFAVAMSYGASPKVMQVAGVAWFAVIVVCLLFAQYILSLSASDEQNAANTVLLLTMLILTFPAGFITVGFAFVYSSLVVSDRSVHQLDLLVLWSAFAAIGYFQWFKLIPYLIDKWRLKKRGRERAPQEKGT